MRHCQEKNLLKVVVSEGFTITTNYHRIHPYNRRPSAIQGDLITEPGVLVRDMLDLEMSKPGRPDQVRLLGWITFIPSLDHSPQSLFPGKS